MLMIPTERITNNPSMILLEMNHMMYKNKLSSILLKLIKAEFEMQQNSNSDRKISNKVIQNYLSQSRKISFLWHKTMMILKEIMAFKNNKIMYVLK